MSDYERMIVAYPLFFEEVRISGVEVALACLGALLAAFLAWWAGGRSAYIGWVVMILAGGGLLGGFVYLMIRLGGAIERLTG